MSTEALSSLNWIDVVAIGILVRVVFIGIKQGIAIEGFKFLGMLFSVFISFHYFTGLSGFVQEKIHTPEGATNLFSFVLLWIVVVVVFKFIRDGFLILIKIDAHSAFDKIVSFLFALGRTVLICSLLLITFKLTDIEYLKENISHSISGLRLTHAASTVYTAIFDGFIHKFFPDEELNKTALALSDFSAEKETQAVKKNTAKTAEAKAKRKK